MLVFTHRLWIVDLVSSIGRLKTKYVNNIFNTWSTVKGCCSYSFALQVNFSWQINLTGFFARICRSQDLVFGQIIFVR